MKLNKIDPNQKKKSKKCIIIGTSTVAVLTIASICGCTLLRGADKDVLKVAQHLVSGPVLQRALEDKEENSGVNVKPDISPDRVIQLETYLNRLGFGYSSLDAIDIFDWENMPIDYEFPIEQTGSQDDFIYLESLYCLYNGIDITTKPEVSEDPGAQPQPQIHQDEVAPDSNVFTVYATWEYKGEEYSTDKYICRTDTTDSWNDVATIISKVQTEALEKIEATYGEDKIQYNNWVTWRGNRNKWIKTMSERGFLVRQDPDEEYDQYSMFWIGIAQKALAGEGTGIEAGEVIDENAVDDLISLLYAQIYDKDGVERDEIPNLLNDILHWQKNGSKDLDRPLLESPNPDGSQIPVDPDMSGGEIPGIDGGSGDGGGTTPGGDDDDDNPGGGDNPGGDDDEDPDDPEVTIPLEVKSLAVTSPLKSGTYGIGQEIKLKVSFSKNIYASTTKENITKVNAPKLYISFVDENNSNTSNKEATFESASGGNLVYTYKITDGDNGELALGQGDNFKGTVFDEDGKMLLLTKIEEMGTTPSVVADTISPTVQAIEVISQEGSYKVGEEVEIKVTFSERVYSNNTGVPILTKTAPKLNISFGDGEIKNPQIKTIDSNGQYLIYRYIIQDDDRGNLKINPSQAFDGSQNIYDSVGNGTVLTAGVDLTGNNVTANADLAIIKLNKTELVLDLNGTKEETLSATTTPDGIEITWSVENDKVATVDSKTGKVTAVAMGETTITATAPDGTKATCKVTVKDTTKGETKLTLNKEEIELDLSGVKEERLRASVVPSDMPLTWTSSDTKVATVDNKTGNVTAVGKGEAIITVKAQDGTKATCKVTVIDSDPKEIEPTGIEFLTINPTVILGRVPTLQMQTRLIPSNCNTNMGITFESSNEEVATVNLNGIVTIKAVGTTVITATTENGKSVSTNLTVIEINDEEDILLGDVTGDGQIDSSDLISMLRHVAACASSDIRIKHQDWLVQGEAYTVMDIDGNGRVDITDVLKLQRHIAFTKSESVQQKHPDWEIK